MLGSIVVVDCLRPDGPVRALPHIQWFAAQGAPLRVAANRCPPESVAWVAQELSVPQEHVVSVDCASRDQVRDIVLMVLEAALTATTPTVVSAEIQARLG